MRNIGISVPHLGPSQLSTFAILFANKLFKTEFDCTLFYRDVATHCMQINAGCMTLSEIWGFRGTLITTSLYDTQFALNSISPGKKIFYVWDLEFLRNEKDFMKNMSIFRNPYLQIAARSQSHASVIENYCNRRPDMIVEDFEFNVNQI